MIDATTGGLTVECDVHVDRRGRGARKAVLPGPAIRREPGRVPRVSRWMALAIRCDELLREGVVDRYADLAELGHVSRPRVTQVMSLLNLAPDIQEALLFLPRTEAGGDAILLRDLLPIAATPDWGGSGCCGAPCVADCRFSSSPATRIPDDRHSPAA